ncbi:C13 family peptidase [Comamonas composti]|uniref:C13 family peptidase n=1 Tax=Comamonas composti TaxID=408558 RepID=UPI000A03A914|nr:C13 family peptidase [Comamonas composti]
MELAPQVDATDPGDIGAQHAQSRLSLWKWMFEGLRASFMLRPRVGEAAPTPWQLLVLYFVCQAFVLALLRAGVSAPVKFVPVAWLAMQWTLPVALWCGWQLMGAKDRGKSLAAWFVLLLWACLLPNLAYLSVFLVGFVWTKWGQALSGHPAYYLLWTPLLWSWLAGVMVGRAFFASRWRVMVYGLLSIAMFVAAVFVNTGYVWAPDYEAIRAAKAEAGEAEEPGFELTQEVFEAQQTLWNTQVNALLPERADTVEVYGLVFAPYADEDVFLRESTMVRELLEQRFDAGGRVLQLINNPRTSASHVWATPLNLQRAIEALAGRMDRDKDVLVVYLTSHGGSNHLLAASHWPLTLEPVSAQSLRQALDAAGVRNRVIAVSACYAGGWIAPLENEDTLIMTAADAEHTSYGCGSKSELTFFGRAVFAEQLSSTHSFAKAFEAAVPLIKAREEEAGKQDGFSNPQISVGARMAPLLQALEQRLDGLETAQ